VFLATHIATLPVTHSLTHSLMSVSVAVSSTQVCHTGYAMDRFCIDRGTLLDNSVA